MWDRESIDNKELIELALKYKVPKVDEYNHVGYDITIGGGFMDRNIVRLLFIKYDDGNSITWQYCRSYISFYDEYTTELHQSIIDKEVEIWKSIYENPNSKQYKSSK